MSRTKKERKILKTSHMLHRRLRKLLYIRKSKVGRGDRSVMIYGDELFYKRFVRTMRILNNNWRKMHGGPILRKGTWRHAS